MGVSAIASVGGRKGDRPMSRWARSLVIIAIFVLFGGVAVSAAAAEPVDPLRRPEEHEGKLQYRSSLYIRPDVSPAIRSDVEPAFVDEYTVTIHAALQYGFSPRLDGTIRGQMEGVGRREGIGSGSSFRWTEGSTTSSGSVGIVWRIAPDHPWAPVASIERAFTRGGAWNGALFGQRISDPIVVSSGFTVHGLPKQSLDEQRADRRSHQLSFGLMTGLTFVFNDDFSGSVSISHRLPTPGQIGTVTALSLALHQDTGFAGRGIDYEFGLTERWNGVRISFGVTWRGWNLRSGTTSISSENR